MHVVLQGRPGQEKDPDAAQFAEREADLASLVLHTVACAPGGDRSDWSMQRMVVVVVVVCQQARRMEGSDWSMMPRIARHA